MNIRLIIPLLVILSSVNLSAAPLTFESTTYQTGLVELYTSEGCSSCPPADRWINSLESHKGLWKEFIPLAFHVDYWDYIGWKDRFAKGEYSQRQQLHARHGNVSTVYTPAIVVNGREIRDWRSKHVPSLSSRKSVGTLKLDIENQRAKARFKPSEQARSAYDLHLALLGFDLSTDAKAGENSGRRLNHDFVVLGSNKTPLRRENGEYSARLPLPKLSTSAPRYGVAGWITHKGQLIPVQAVGGWLPEAVLAIVGTHK